MTIKFVLDDNVVETSGNETILQIAKEYQIEIPYLCFKEGYRPDGNCRSCVVEIEGERTLAPSCCRYPENGMTVKTSSKKVKRNQRMILELLDADLGEKVSSTKPGGSELDFWLKKFDINLNRFPKRDKSFKAIDTTNPAIQVNLNQCIKCTRCLRACREEQANDVIGLSMRGAESSIIFDIQDPLGDSSCVTCGECVQACPTDALLSKVDFIPGEKTKSVKSVCPYCGVGCLLNYEVQGNKIKSTTGRDGPSNTSRLCVKGRYGFDYVHHEDRLKKPLIRLEEIPKTTEIIELKNIKNYFREASWNEALDFAAGGLLKIKDNHGHRSLAGLGSAKGSNEEAYLFQKLIRTGFGNNNVDHCTRLCHASSVAAMLEMLGSAAVSNQVADIGQTDVAIIIGAKPTVNHPVAATFMKNAAKNSVKIIVIDPYRSELTRHSEYFLQIRPDTDVALLNSLMHVIIDEDLFDKKFVEKRTENFDQIRCTVSRYSPEEVAPICGISAPEIRNVALLYAKAPKAMIFWGMGISQHIHGTDNARCLISLALLCGHIGSPGSGIHPLRGQNNVQGASDSGLIPMVYPNYQPVNEMSNRKRFEELWGSKLDNETGLTVTEMTEAAHGGNLKGMYIMGENPAMSDPNLNHTRTAFTRLEHLVVQDIFFTETAGFADVILPASAFPEKTGSFTNTDRRVQIGRQAIDPPGDAKQDLWIIQELAKRFGLTWNYKNVEDVYDELREANDSISGISWQLLMEHDSLTYPFTSSKEESETVLFKEFFPTASGKARFVSAEYSKADELPDESFPFIFITGRQLEHWHTGSMTHRSRVLKSLEPEAVVNLNPSDMEAIGCNEHQPLTIESRRGQLTATVRADFRIQVGTIFMAFCYGEAAANLLTNEAIDPYGKIPEFKFCAVRIHPVRN